MVALWERALQLEPGPAPAGGCVGPPGLQVSRPSGAGQLFCSPSLVFEGLLAQWTWLPVCALGRSAKLPQWV